MNRILCGMALAVLSTYAHAHVTLEQQSAPAGSTYKAVFRVGHGCDGSPTTAVTIFLPDGFNGFKPMPKPGWLLEVRNEALAQPYESHGKPVTERVASVTWRGGRLLDSEYDEFVLRGSLPASAGKRWIRVLQQCEKGQNDWAQIPTPGASRPPFPAAALELMPATSTVHKH